MTHRNRMCSGADVIFLVGCHVRRSCALLEFDREHALVRGDIQRQRGIMREHAYSVSADGRNLVQYLIDPITDRCPANRSSQAAVRFSCTINTGDEQPAAAIPEP